MFFITFQIRQINVIHRKSINQIFIFAMIASDGFKKPMLVFRTMRGSAFIIHLFVGPTPIGMIHQNQLIVINHDSPKI